MQHLPIFISIIFALTTGITVFLFYRATHKSIQSALILLFWILLQSFISLSGFYKVTDALPPRFIALVLPPLLVILILFFTGNGKKYIDSLDLKILTLLHVIRIPVELVIYWLFLNKAVPELMTFEGRNFDIFAGLTAPLIYYFGFVKKHLNNGLLLLWNFICLLLLLNIVFNAIFSAPFPFQKFGFDQPNIAILYFPFVLLPGCIVPVVLFCHLAAIRQLTRKRQQVMSLH